MFRSFNISSIRCSLVLTLLKNTPEARWRESSRTSMVVKHLFDKKQLFFNKKSNFGAVRRGFRKRCVSSLLPTRAHFLRVRISDGVIREVPTVKSIMCFPVFTNPLLSLPQRISGHATARTKRRNEQKLTVTLVK